VFAPADPLLIRYARNWSISEPCHIRLPRPETAGQPLSAGASHASLPLQALDDAAGETLRPRGSQLPGCLGRST